MNRFCLFTSVKPPASDGELSYLRECIGSWRIAGFDVVAVNGPSEIEALRPLNLPVEFALLPIDGKPRIGAILSAIREREARFAGIINSDCQIIGYFPEIARNLYAGLDRRCILGWRVDIHDGNLLPFNLGFDVFFFDTAIVPTDDDGFSIGEPWWDFWFPYACQANGATIEALQFPLLMHRAHVLNWSWEGWMDRGRRFWVTQGISGVPSKADLHALATSIPAKLHDMIGRISIMPPDVESIFRHGAKAMLTLSEIKQLRAETVALRAETVALRNSTSWRITAPLRATVTAARGLAASLF